MPCTHTHTLLIPLIDLDQVEIQALRAELEEKNTLLSERDEALEAIERKMDALGRTRTAEAKRKDRDLSTCKGALEESRARATQLDEEVRKKDTEIRALQIKLKNAKRNKD